MVWRMGTRPYKALRAAYRHRLYAFGIFTWFLTLGLIGAGLQWDPNKSTGDKFVSAKVSAQDTADGNGPQVAGLTTVTPTNPSTDNNSSQQVRVEAGGTSQRITMPTVSNPNPGFSITTPTIIIPTPDNPDPGQTPPADPIIPDPQPGPPETPPPPPPPTDPTPPPPPPPPSGPTPNTACTVDPLLNFGLLGATSVTIPVGGQSAAQTVSASDGSNVIWQPSGSIVWGDGTTAGSSSPVSMVLTNNPGSIVGSSVSFQIRALETAAPGTYSVSWHVEDGTRGVCQTVNIQITVEAVAPPPPPPATTP
jgi:hypothetical protein